MSFSICAEVEISYPDNDIAEQNQKVVVVVKEQVGTGALTLDCV